MHCIDISVLVLNNARLVLLAGRLLGLRGTQQHVHVVQQVNVVGKIVGVVGVIHLGEVDGFYPVFIVCEKKCLDSLSGAQSRL